MKRTGEAEEILRRLLATDPKNTDVMTALAWTLHAEEKEEEALAQYEAVISLSPADQDALYNSGIILWKLERKREALERFQKVLSLAPDDTDALFAAGSLLLALDDPSGADDMLSRYLDKKPEDIEAWYLVAASTEHREKYSRTLEAFEKVLALDAKQADAWFGEARLLLTVIEDPDKGLNALSKALDAGFKDVQAVKALLDAPRLLERKKVEEAFRARNLPPAESEGAPEEEKPAAGGMSPGATEGKSPSAERAMTPPSPAR
jgi:tetratricopeptide (TPR) repeat protein